MMGVVPAFFRTWPGVLRSSHPVTSFAALGLHAAYLTDNHILEADPGNRSPVGRLYDLDGHVLLLGVDHWNSRSASQRTPTVRPCFGYPRTAATHSRAVAVMRAKSPFATASAAIRLPPMPSAAAPAAR